MNNHQINKFVAAHINKTSQPAAKAKANKKQAAKSVANGVGPVFPTVAQPGFPAPAKGKKGPVGTTKKGSSKKSNGLGKNIHIHIHTYGDNSGGSGGY